MKRSTDRILTTHVGSLVRPADLVELVRDRDFGRPLDEAQLEARTREAINDAVRKQLEIGLDIINDGEMGRPSFGSYVKDRMTGFGGEAERVTLGDLDAFPEYAKMRLLRDESNFKIATPACIGPVTYADQEAPRRDVERLRAGIKAAGKEPLEVFLPAASPGIISSFLQNQHYPTLEAYIYALADAMKTEYHAVTEAGFVLQIDSPDLAMAHHREFHGRSRKEFLAFCELCIEALNHALEGISPDRVRLHVCWGNYEGPHIFDVPLRDIIDIVLKANVGGLSIEAANPRHGHEWKVFEDVKLPDGMVLIPGVIDTTTNQVEHPELVAERIVRFANIVGRENVIASTDCGFGTFIGRTQVEDKVSWAKLQSLVEGARLASEQLW